MPHALSARLARLERTRAAAALGCVECRGGVGLAVAWCRQHGPDEAPPDPPSPPARTCAACGRVGPPRVLRLVPDADATPPPQGIPLR